MPELRVDPELPGPRPPELIEGSGDGPVACLICNATHWPDDPVLCCACGEPVLVVGWAP